ncbi:MAG: DUF222 domain-containing protein [Acidimicrobiales bacterium]
MTLTEQPPTIGHTAAALPTERLEAEIVQRTANLAHHTYELLVLIGELDHRGTWALWGAHSCATWLADATDLDLGTAHTHVRVARAMRTHPTLAHALATHTISYAKARALTPHLTEANATELLAIAQRVPAANLGQAIAAWSRRNEHPDDIDQRQHHARSLRWRTDPDGLITITARLEPHVAATICAAIDHLITTNQAPTHPPQPRTSPAPADPPDPRTGPAPADADAHAQASSSNADGTGTQAPNAPASTANTSPATSDPNTDHAPADATTTNPDATSTQATNPPAGTTNNNPATSDPNTDHAPADADTNTATTNEGPARANARPAPAGATLAQRRADALVHLITTSTTTAGRTAGRTTTTAEIVIHVDETGTHLPDGTPLSNHPITALLDHAFISLLIHDTHRWPIDASPRRRLPTRRQRRVLDARHPTCTETGCTCPTHLQADHQNPYSNGGTTTLDNLTLRCGPHNRQKSNAT